MSRTCFALLCLLLLPAVARAQKAENLCPNPGMEDAGPAKAPAGWRVEFGGNCAWADDAAHAGKRSLKITSAGGPTVAWTSAPIPARPGSRLFLRVWVKMDQVTGRNGASIGLYTLGADGKRNGQTAFATAGGAGDLVATADWQECLAIGEPLADGVAAVCVNVRLYGAAGTAWFDDVSLSEFRPRVLDKPRPIRRGVDLRRAAIVAGAGQQAAEQVRALARERAGAELTVLRDDAVDLAQPGPDLLVLGTLVDNRVAEHLYTHSYTIEDLGFPGKGGYVLRPLVDPLGTGRNFLVVGASDPAGLAAGIARLGESLAGASGGVLRLPLVVRRGEDVGKSMSSRVEARREMAYVAAYMKSGDLEPLRRYREEILKTWFVTDERLFATDESLHLYYVTRTLSWDLANDSEVFSDAERLKITLRLLEMLRSGQGFGYSGLHGQRVSRENHGTRAAEAFYYGWRHFSKYYRDELDAELFLWRRKLEEYWRWPLGSSRSYEDSLSQHALGGSLVNALNIGLMEPAWSREFFKEFAARMGDRCIAI